MLRHWHRLLHLIRNSKLLGSSGFRRIEKIGREIEFRRSKKSRKEGFEIHRFA